MGYIIVLKLQRLPVIQELKDMPISQKIQNLLPTKSKKLLDWKQETNPSNRWELLNHDLYQLVIDFILFNNFGQKRYLLLQGYIEREKSKLNNIFCFYLWNLFWLFFNFYLV